MDDLPQWLQDILRSNEVVAAVIAFVLYALLELIQRTFAPRGRLKWAISHQYLFLIPPQLSAQSQPQPELASEGSQAVAVGQPSGPTVSTPGVIRTREIWIQNAGRAPVQDIEIVLNYRPHHYQIWPQRAFRDEVNPAGALVISVDSLGYREFFTIAMIDIRELPDVANVRSSDGVGRQVTMGPGEISPRWKLELLRVVLFIGVFSSIYWMIRLIRGL